MISDGQYAVLKKHAMRMNFSWEALKGTGSDRTPVYRNRSRWWLLQRRVANWALFRLLNWAERKKFVEGGLCYECPGYPEPTTDLDYFAGWEDGR
jgi:hypothetical protein